MNYLRPRAVNERNDGGLESVRIADTIEKTYGETIGLGNIEFVILIIRAYKRKPHLPYLVTIQQQGYVRRDTKKPDNNRFIGGHSLTGEQTSDLFATNIHEESHVETLIDQLLDEYKRVNAGDKGDLHGYRAWILSMPEIAKDLTQEKGNIGDIRFSGSLDRVKDSVNPSDVASFYEVPLPDVPSRMFIYRRKPTEPLNLRVEMKFDTPEGPSKGEMVMEAITDRFSEEDQDMIFLLAPKVFGALCDVVQSKHDALSDTSSFSNELLLLYFRPILKVATRGDNFTALTFITLKDFSTPEVINEIVRFEGLHSKKQIMLIPGGVRPDAHIPANRDVSVAVFPREYYEGVLRTWLDQLADRIRGLNKGHPSKQTLEHQVAAAQQRFDELLPDNAYRTLSYSQWVSELNQWDMLNQQVEQIDDNVSYAARMAESAAPALTGDTELEQNRVKGFTDFYPELISGNVQAVDEDRFVYVTVDFERPVNKDNVCLVMHHGDPAKGEPWKDVEAAHINDYGSNHRFKVVVPIDTEEYTLKASFDKGKTWHWMGWNARLASGEEAKKIRLQQAIKLRIAQAAKRLQNKIDVIKHLNHFPESEIAELENIFGCIPNIPIEFGSSETFGVIPRHDRISLHEVKFIANAEILSEFNDLELDGALLHESIHLLGRQCRHTMEVFHLAKRLPEKVSVIFHENEEAQGQRRDYLRAILLDMTTEVEAYLIQLRYLVASGITDLRNYFKKRKEESERPESKRVYDSLEYIYDSGNRIKTSGLMRGAVMKSGICSDFYRILRALFLYNVGYETTASAWNILPLRWSLDDLETRFDAWLMGLFLTEYLKLTPFTKERFLQDNSISGAAAAPQPLPTPKEALAAI